MSGDIPNPPSPERIEQQLQSVQDLLPALIELASIQHDLLDELQRQSDPGGLSIHHYILREGKQAITVKIRVPQLISFKNRSNMLLQWLLAKAGTHL